MLAVTLPSFRSGIDPLVMTGSSGELLDEQARQEYCRRFREPQEKFRKARANDDSPPHLGRQGNLPFGRPFVDGPHRGYSLSRQALLPTSCGFSTALPGA